MKILFVSHNSELGGAENVLYRLLKGIPKDKYGPVCLLPRSGSLERKIRQLGVKTCVGDLKWWVACNGNIAVSTLEWCRGLQKRIEGIVEILRSNDIDLVVTNTIVINEGAIAAKVAGIPHIWHIHEVISECLALRPPVSYRRLYSSVVALSDTVVAVSRSVKNEIEYYLKSPSPKIKIVYNGIDNKELSSVNNDKTMIFSAGLICRRKGMATFLNAARYVHEAMPDIRFVVAGRITEREYYNELLRLREQFGLTDYFEFCGFQEDLAEYYRDASIFVLSSNSEPFGLVILEAMAAGKPVVATDCGGPSEMVVAGKTGFIVPVNDSRAMADKILYLLRHEDIAAQMGKAGKDRADNCFSQEKFIGDFAAVVDSVSLRKGEYPPDSRSYARRIREVVGSMGLSGMYNAFALYERIENSAAAKLYRRSGFLKVPIRKMIGLSVNRNSAR